MAKNTNLNSAARAQKDEFYTQRSDIENELQHYWQHFAGKTVLCNCDDPFESQFFYYFTLKFNFLKLKRLIATSYTGSPVQGDLFNPVNDAKPAYKVVINRLDKEPLDAQAVTDIMYELKAALGNNTTATVDDNTLSLLAGDEGKFPAGDFRSSECVKLLRQADIVVTNPPFSLFRQFVALLVKFKKKFLIIGNQNAITYKEIFPMIVRNELWLGYGFQNSDAYFSLPSGQYKDFADGVYNAATGLVKFRNLHWFTNMEHDKRNRPYELTGSYEDNPEMYPRYDNYDAIEVSKTADIPQDYFGVMGVPITFLDKYCPEQFELIWTSDRGGDGMIEWLKRPHTRYDAPVVDGKGTYKRIFIRRRV